MLARLVGPLLIPLALGAGMFFQIVYPGDFDYVLQNPAPALDRLVRGRRRRRRARRRVRPRRRPPLEIGAAIASAAFLTPVFGGGLLHWKPPDTPELATLSPGPASPPCVATWGRGTIVVLRCGDELPARGLRTGLHRGRRRRATSRTRRKNRPYERAQGRCGASSARATSRSRDGYGADYVVVDADRSDLQLDLPIVVPGRALHALPPLDRLAPAAAARGLDPEEVAGARGRGSRSRGAPPPLRKLRPGRPSSPPRAPRGASARRCVRSESRHALEDRSSRTTPSPPRVATRAARSETELVALDAERIGELERLGRRVVACSTSRRGRRRARRRPGTRPGRRRSSRST